MVVGQSVRFTCEGIMGALRVGREKEKFGMGKGAYSRTKKGLRARTTGSECDRYDSYLQTDIVNTRVSVRKGSKAYQKSSM